MTTEQIARFLSVSLDYTSQLIAEAKEEMPHIHDREEAKRIYFSAPSDSRLERFALEEWERFSLKEVESANTAEQIREAFENCHEQGSRAEELAILKLAEMPYPEEEE